MKKVLLALPALPVAAVFVSATPLTPAEALEIGSFRWSPDGTRIALLMSEAKSDTQEQREKDKDDGRVVDKDRRLPRVWTVDVASHELKQIASAPFRIRQAHDLWLQAVSGGAAQNINGATLDRPVAQPRWIDDRTVAATVERGFNSAIALITSDGQARTLDAIDVSPSAFACSPSGTVA